MLLNRYNFLRWSDETPEPGQPDVPVAYWKDREHIGYMPVLYPTETLSFYINSEDGVLYDFADLRLALTNAKTDARTATDIGTLQQHFIDDTNTPYNIYCTLQNPAVPDGIYYLEIYKSSDSSRVITSNYVLVRSDKAQLDAETTYCKFAHDRSLFHIKYHELPGFHQQFRLHISQIERQPESDREVYKEVTTGQSRVFNAILSRYVKFESYYFDPAAHEAAAVMIEHNDVYFNGKPYTQKTPYREPATVQSKLGKGEFEMYDNEFAQVNRC